jgi:hypothetical protein
MRTFVIGLCVMTLGGWLCSTAAAQQPGQDSVSGTFTISEPGVGTFDYSVDAHSGPSGEDPGGTFIVNPGGAAETVYRIACLRVGSNFALIGANFDGFSLLKLLVDGPVDTISTGDWPTGTPLDADDCTTRNFFFSPPSSVIAGDIVVTDARLLPTTKAECKNGSWQAFGVFKNQGDCVSFVATGGRNQPSGP